MPFKPAQSGYSGGRPVGTPNRMTTAVREAIMAAFDEVGAVDYLVKVANDNLRIDSAS